MLVVSKALWCRSSFVESEAVEMTLLPYARHWHTIPFCSAGILCLQVRRASVLNLNTFCVSVIDWTFLLCVKIPDYVCSLPKIIGLSVGGWTLACQFTLRRQGNHTLYFKREIHKSRAATIVIFPVFLPNAWLLLLWQINLKGRKAGLRACTHCSPLVCSAGACWSVGQCVHRLHSVTLAVPWVI